MTKPLLAVHLGDASYDDAGRSTAVQVDFRETDGTAFVSTAAYNRWLLVSQWPTTPEEATQALEMLMQCPGDGERVHGWARLTADQRWKVLANLRFVAASDTGAAEA